MLREVAYLGGYLPDSVMTAGNLFDVRFLEDRLVIFASGQADVLVEVSYGQVEHVEIGGPGPVRSGGGFAGGGLGVTGADADLGIYAARSYSLMKPVPCQNSFIAAGVPFHAN
jgi:hypothetical protein